MVIDSRTAQALRGYGLNAANDATKQEMQAIRREFSEFRREFARQSTHANIQRDTLTQETRVGHEKQARASEQMAEAGRVQARR